MSARVGHGASIDAGVVSVTSVVDFDSVAMEWNALAERSGSIFSTALWARLWWAHFGGDRGSFVRSRWLMVAHPTTRAAASTD